MRAVIPRIRFLPAVLLVALGGCGEAPPQSEPPPDMQGIVVVTWLREPSPIVWIDVAAPPDRGRAGILLADATVEREDAAGDRRRASLEDLEEGDWLSVWTSAAERPTRPPQYPASRVLIRYAD